MYRYKMTLACLVIMLYLVFSFCHDGRKKQPGGKKGTVSTRIFRILLINGLLSLNLDIVTVYTVNHLETVPLMLNRIVHLFFLLGIDLEIFETYLYLLAITDTYPKSRKRVLLTFLPFILNAVVLVATIPMLEFRIGKVTNYSMGVPAYTCYIMVVVYVCLAVFSFVKNWRYINSNKRICIAFSLTALSVIMVIQMLFPETLISSLTVTVIVLCIYVTIENRAIRKLESFQEETLVAFSDVIESRDDSTGEHVKRTTAYVNLLVKGLRERGLYKNILTRDYVDNLLMAAPMHDIGKIGVPDSILQKPGKLTKEEFSKMQEHTVIGKQIVEMTLSKIEEKQYVDMARDVAWCHHEKWDGSGYPRGISGADIPLSARIMAVADVFDAISQHRCYRPAMPLDQCFAIIEEGKGTHFDPQIAEVFLELRPEIVEVHREMNDKPLQETGKAS